DRSLLIVPRDDERDHACAPLLSLIRQTEEDSIVSPRPQHTKRGALGQHLREHLGATNSTRGARYLIDEECAFLDAVLAHDRRGRRLNGRLDSPFLPRRSGGQGGGGPFVPIDGGRVAQDSPQDARCLWPWGAVGGKCGSRAFPHHRPRLCP